MKTSSNNSKTSISKQSKLSFAYILSRVLNSRLSNILILPISLYNMIGSFIIYLKEDAIMQESINDNFDLFDRLDKLAFTNYDYAFINKGIYTYVPFTEQMGSAASAKELIRKNFVSMLDAIIIDNDLLGVTILNVTVNHKYARFKLELIPANKSMCKSNIIDLSISMIIWSVLTTVLMLNM